MTIINTIKKFISKVVPLDIYIEDRITTDVMISDPIRKYRPSRLTPKYKIKDPDLVYELESINVDHTARPDIYYTLVMTDTGKSIMVSKRVFENLFLKL
jgi:hypothetical protein